MYFSGSFFVEGTQVKWSVPAAVKWSEVKPGAHLWPQFQPEPASGSFKMVEGQKSRVKDGETSALATLTPAPLTSRRSSVEKRCSTATHACRAGKSRVESAVHRSQPSTNPHNLPDFKFLNSSLAQFWTLQGVPAKPMRKDSVHHLLFTFSMLCKNIFWHKTKFIKFVYINLCLTCWLRVR